MRGIPATGTDLPHDLYCPLEERVCQYVSIKWMRRQQFMRAHLRVGELKRHKERKFGAHAMTTKLAESPVSRFSITWRQNNGSSLLTILSLPKRINNDNHASVPGLET